MRAAVDCREMDQGDVREEIVVGNACLWRKAGQTWKQGASAESRVGGGAIAIASLSPHASIAQLNNIKAGPSNT